MIVLAVNTAHAVCSACVYDSVQSKMLASIEEPMTKGQAERLPELVDAVLSQAGLELAQIDRLAACNGPGTFMGVRIGLSYIRGLALVLKVPAIGITTFAALAREAHSQRPDLPVWVVQDARREQVYLQGFDAEGQELQAAQVMSVEAAEGLLNSQTGALIGSAQDLLQLPATLECLDASGIPSIAHIATLAAQADPEAAPAEPMYLRAPDAKPQAQLVRHNTLDVEIVEVSAMQSEAVVQLQNICFDEPWSQSTLAATMAMPVCTTLVAQHRGKPCGFAITRQAADEVEIILIGVIPAMRRRRVAHVLLEEIRARAKLAGAASIFIEYATDNDAAAAFYAAAGFEQSGFRKGYYLRPGGVSCDAVTAQLKP